MLRFQIGCVTGGSVVAKRKRTRAVFSGEKKNPREIGNNNYAKIWRKKQRVLWNFRKMADFDTSRRWALV